jgi:hypothetical protein
MDIGKHPVVSILVLGDDIYLGIQSINRPFRDSGLREEAV